MLASSQIPRGVCEPSALKIRARLNFVISKKQKNTMKVFSCFWPTRKDSNLRPSESESDALSSCATGRNKLFLLYTRIALVGNDLQSLPLGIEFYKVVPLKTRRGAKLPSRQYSCGMRSLWRYPAVPDHSRGTSYRLRKSSALLVCALGTSLQKTLINRFLCAHHG